MQQTNGVTSVMSQEQSDLVTSVTISTDKKDAMKNGKSVIINN
ncbi:CLUMA_CG014334, isoform A, partial [Clunio marinus]